MDDRSYVQDFANRHKLIFEDRGEVGIGRPCVGLLRNDRYLDYHPHDVDYEPITDPTGLHDARLAPPAFIEDVYHKHDCVCVLVHNDDYDRAIAQLSVWLQELERQGNIEIVRFHTGATGLQTMFTGAFGYAIRFK